MDCCKSGLVIIIPKMKSILRSMLLCTAFQKQIAVSVKKERKKTELIAWTGCKKNIYIFPEG